MRRAVQNPDGTTIGTIGDDCVFGQVVGPVLNPRDGKQDIRPDSEVLVTLNVNGLTLEQVKALQGRKVALFTIEEE